jgi:hypothetical protein
MALPRSLTSPFRQGQLTVGAGWRAYFSPFNQQAAVSQSSTQIGPTIYDLLATNKFLDNAAYPGYTGSSVPAGWFDLGWIKNFKFTPGSKIGNVMSGYRGAVRAKYRGEVGEKFSFSFAEMGRMQLSISTGAQIFNALVTTEAAGAAGGPLSASGTAAIAIGASGYSATGFGGVTANLPTLCLPAGSGALFGVGTYIVCDQDYNNTTFGYVGAAGANVFQGAVTDVDFIRKTSDFVNGVVAVYTGGASPVSGQDTVVLTGPFVGGGNAPYLTTPATTPPSGSKVQAINGYIAREGGTFIREWSAIFVLDTIDGSQILFYYPRVAPDTFTGIPGANIQNITSEQEYDLETSLETMAYDDPLDGETVVAYRAYFPHSGTNPQI